MAEGVGFEPTVACDHTWFRVKHLQPLGHSSANAEILSQSFFYVKFWCNQTCKIFFRKIRQPWSGICRLVCRVHSPDAKVQAACLTKRQCPRCRKHLKSLGKSRCSTRCPSPWKLFLELCLQAANDIPKSRWTFCCLWIGRRDSRVRNFVRQF